MPLSRVKPFKGLLYAPEAAPIAKVVTEPYDKISPPMQKAYYRRHPYNFVRLILGKTPDRYRQASRLLDTWVAKGILRQDASQAYYLYGQTFRLPWGTRKTREGIIGLMRLEDFAKGNVLPHEHTLAKPRKDRLRLLRATQANLEQIFLLYGDGRETLQKQMQAWKRSRPCLDFRDERGIRQRLWRITAPGALKAVSGFLDGRKFFIADGHHRYAISLQYHKQLAVSRAGATLRRNSAWRMATFVNMHSDGLVILPTHRVVPTPRGWNFRRFLRDLQKDFTVQDFPLRGGLVRTAAALARGIRQGQGPAKTPVFGVLTRSAAAILRLRRNAGTKRGLDVEILHRMVLRRYLGLDPKSIERKERIAYIREPEEVARCIAKGAFGVGFLQNPPDIAQVKRLALAGRCMPQKSTDFYPKLLSGLVVYDMKGRSQ